MAVTVSDMDRKLLKLIADGEAVRSNPYCSVWPGSVEPSLTSMTLSQVQDYQTQRINSGRESSAVGKYQFIKSTLKDCIGYLGCDPLRVCFTSDVQDALIIKRLEKTRRYSKWKSGELDSGKFMIFLAAEFASMPVPYDIAAGSVYKGLPKRNLKKGQSFYAGDGLNKSNHNPDSVYQALEDIRNGGEGNISDVDVTTTGGNRARPPSGISTKSQVEATSAGSQTGAYRPTRAGAMPLPNVDLPVVDNPYVYYQIDALDDRYDFRSGEKVKDILVHGINAAAISPVVVSDPGVAGGTSDVGTSPSSADATGETESVQNPDALDPRGQEQLPDLVPKEVPAPVPTGEDGNIDITAPALPYIESVIDDALNSIPVFGDLKNGTAPCLDSVTGAGGYVDAIDSAINNLSPDVTGLVNQAKDGLTDKAKNAAQNLTKSWTNT